MPRNEQERKYSVEKMEDRPAPLQRSMAATGLLRKNPSSDAIDRMKWLMMVGLYERREDCGKKVRFVEV